VLSHKEQKEEKKQKQKWKKKRHQLKVRNAIPFVVVISFLGF
jgi:P pilus assembly chaperone PapD